MNLTAHDLFLFLSEREVPFPLCVLMTEKFEDIRQQLEKSAPKKRQRRKRMVVGNAQEIADARGIGDRISGG